MPKAKNRTVPVSNTENGSPLVMRLSRSANFQALVKNALALRLAVKKLFRPAQDKKFVSSMQKDILKKQLGENRIIATSALYRKRLMKEFPELRKLSRLEFVDVFTKASKKFKDQQRAKDPASYP